MPRAKVKRVIDGDTLEIKSSEKVRIANLNTPEMNQPGGPAAKRRLQQLLPRGTDIGLSDVQAKSYDRNVRKVSVDGKDVAKLMQKPPAQKARKK